MYKRKNMNLQLFGEGGEEQTVAEQPAQQEPREEPEEAKAPEQDARTHQFREHFQSLEAQAEAMKQTFPGFDLRRELRNPLFARLTSPGVGIGVEDAFYTVHRSEIQKAAVQAVQRQMSRSIASGGRRPLENGFSGQAPAVSAFDYRSASREQREDLKRRIRLAAAEGKKLYPGRGRE